MPNEQSRFALVTGGTSGIGAAIAVALRDNGATIVANYANNDEQAAEFTRRTGIATAKWSVADFDACQAGVAALTEVYGPVEILVNNAGITRDSSFTRMDQSQWSDVLSTNLYGCFHMAKAVFAGMRDRQWGRIVNIGSINGQKGQFGQVNYSAAKAALSGFTKSLALEGAKHGVTVNLVAPGYTDTPMVRAVPPAVLETIVAGIPAGRLVQPEEVAACVTMLCSDAAATVTGSTLSVNGGQLMSG